MSRALNCDRQLALVACAGSSHPAGQNFCSLRNKSSKLCSVFIINTFHFVRAKRTYFSAFSSAVHTIRSFKAIRSVGPVRPVGPIIIFSHCLSSSLEKNQNGSSPSSSESSLKSELPEGIPYPGAASSERAAVSFFGSAK